MGCCGTRRTACATRPLLYDDASSGDGTRRAILEAVLSLDATPAWRLLEDGRGLGSSDLRCWREVDERVIGSEREGAFLCRCKFFVCLVYAFVGGLKAQVDGDQEG